VQDSLGTFASELDELIQRSKEFERDLKLYLYKEETAAQVAYRAARQRLIEVSRRFPDLSLLRTSAPGTTKIEWRGTETTRALIIGLDQKLPCHLLFQMSMTDEKNQLSPIYLVEPNECASALDHAIRELIKEEPWILGVFPELEGKSC